MFLGDTLEYTNKQKEKKIIFIPLPQVSCNYHFSCYVIFCIICMFKRAFLSEGKGGRKRGRETSMCGCLLCAPDWRRGTQPRHVP